MRTAWVFLFSLYSVASVWGQSSISSTWNAAVAAYGAEDYSSALQQFRSLEGKRNSDDLYYNIANCFYRIDSVPQAILYYERAIKYNPRNQEARDNLELAKSKMDEPVVRIRPFFLLRWINGAATALSPLAWGIVVLVLLWLMAFGYTRVIRTGRSLRLRERIVPLLVFLVVLFLGYVSFHQRVRDDLAVVMIDTALHEAPDDLSPSARVLEGGEKVYILDHLDGYVKVRLVNFEVGWIPGEAIIVI